MESYELCAVLCCTVQCAAVEIEADLFVRKRSCRDDLRILFMIIRKKEKTQENSREFIRTLENKGIRSKVNLIYNRQ